MRSIKLTAFGLAATLSLLQGPAFGAGLDGPIRTTAGLVSPDPQLENGVRVFRGIPFAAPPVGDLRWKAPAPPAKWTGVREARSFSPECAQGDAGDPLYSLYYPQIQPQSEDCLYLNVWTPARTPQDRLAVLVWIYGGGFQIGSGSQPMYDPVNLAKRGIVAVTFNYRVGVLGFFAHPELSKESGHDSSGNYGFLDQIAALKWVHDNIAAFGGDPNRVTVAGHSAGAGSTSVLAVSPLAKGLIHRAIPQSLAPGSALRDARRPPLKEIEKTGVEFATRLGASSIAELRKKSSAELLDAARTARFMPCVDGYVLRYDVATSYEKGLSNGVQLIAGEVKDTAQLASSGRSHITADQLKERVAAQYGALSNEFYRLFPIPAGADGADIAAKNANDAQGFWRAWKLAMVHAQYAKAPTYLYYFLRAPQVPPGEYHGVPGAAPGAFHGVELSYMFDNLGFKKWPWTEWDRKLTDIMSSYWVNFIKTGNPNGAGLPKWPMFSPTAQQAMQLGDSVDPMLAPKEIVNLFEKIPGTVGP
jgi:para-nitrobenzyl esterase